MRVNQENIEFSEKLSKTILPLTWLNLSVSSSVQYVVPTFNCCVSFSHKSEDLSVKSWSPPWAGAEEATQDQNWTDRLFRQSGGFTLRIELIG